MAPDSPQQLLTTVDQLGREVRLPYPPHRIVSLVPSQTELLFDLGLREQLVGVTKFCVHPPEARARGVIGGTKNFDFAKIRAAQPDLIIGNKEENYREGVEELARHYPVWMSDVADLPQALDLIRRIGAVTGQPRPAELLAAEIGGSFGQLPPVPALVPAAYLIWRKPWMAAGGNTFINDMLGRAGFANVFGHLGRYPEVSAEALAAAAPARVLLSSEPYPFGAKHLAEVQALCPAAQVQLVDGELFSWYGSRLRQSAAYFAGLRTAG